MKKIIIALTALAGITLLSGCAYDYGYGWGSRYAYGYSSFDHPYYGRFDCIHRFDGTFCG